MNFIMHGAMLVACWLGSGAASSWQGIEHTHPLNTWVKRTPLEDTPPSPRLGYEGACVWDSKHRVVIRFGGHNQGGGGEQGAEVWTYDPFTAKWTLKEPNTSPPGVCCNTQNVFDPVRARYIRFPFFSGSHGWQWPRELYLNDSSVWTYDLRENRWRNLLPLPAPRLAPLRCASWDSDHQVVVVFGGEGSREGTVVYNPHRNEWQWKKPPHEPEPRSGGNMAYDAACKLHVLFGSQFTDDPHTWAYDLAKNEWRDLKPATMPVTHQNDAVLTYDSISKKIIAIIKITEGTGESARHELQTWSFDTAAKHWTRLKPGREPDPSGNRARQLLFAPELNLAILENCTSKPREQQIWTYRLTEARPVASETPKSRYSEPSIVDTVVATVRSPKQIELSWTPSAEAGIAGYHVERAIVEVLSEDQLRSLKSRTPPLSQPSVGAIRRIGEFQRITTRLLTDPKFVDESVALEPPAKPPGEIVYERTFPREELDESGTPYRFTVYAYRVRAVNQSGAESGPSAPAFSIPSPPQWVFSREDQHACELKWQANPEPSVTGYRVYRMDGRWAKDGVSRLTEQPLRSLNYRDDTAGTSTRRYYIVAVDALGQEGFPSAPVWYRREWQQFYLPFTEAWHQ